MTDERESAETLAAMLDGLRTDGADARLCAAVEQNPELALRLARQLALESALRGLAPAPDVSAMVMGALRARESDRSRDVVTNVMVAVNQGERWPVRKRRRRAQRTAYVTAGVVGALALAAYASWRWTAGDGRSGEPPVASPAVDQPLPKQPPNVAGPAHAPPVRIEPDPPQPAPPDPAVLFRFDFEDGLLPPGFEQGQVVADASRPGNRFAIIGTFNAWAPSRASVFVNPGRPLFFYERGLVLRFRCHPGGVNGRVRLQVFDADQRQNHQFDVENLPANTWTNVEVALDRFYAVTRRGQSPANGDRMNNLFIITGAISQRPVLIDDLELVRTGP